MSERTIWKFELLTQGVQLISLPEGAEILSVGLDPKDRLCIWAIVSPEPKYTDTGREYPKYEDVKITVCGTGRPCECPRSEFIGTVRMAPFMWHIFASKQC